MLNLSISKMNFKSKPTTVEKKLIVFQSQFVYFHKVCCAFVSFLGINTSWRLKTNQLRCSQCAIRILVNSNGNLRLSLGLNGVLFSCRRANVAFESQRYQMERKKSTTFKQIWNQYTNQYCIIFRPCRDFLGTKTIFIRAFSEDRKTVV